MNDSDSSCSFRSDDDRALDIDLPAEPMSSNNKVILSFEVSPPFLQDGQEQQRSSMEENENDCDNMSVDSSHSPDPPSVKKYFIEENNYDEDDSCWSAISPPLSSSSDSDSDGDSSSASIGSFDSDAFDAREDERIRAVYENVNIDWEREIIGANDTETPLVVFGLEITFSQEDYGLDCAPNASLWPTLRKKIAMAERAASKRSRELQLGPKIEYDLRCVAEKAVYDRHSLEIDKPWKAAREEFERKEAEKQKEQRKLVEQREAEEDQIYEQRGKRRIARERKEFDEWEEMASEFLDWLDEAHLDHLFEEEWGHCR